MPAQDIHIIGLVKTNERYIFIYDDCRTTEIIRMLGRFASNPDLSFTWYDAAILSQKARQIEERTEAKETKTEKIFKNRFS